MTPSPDTTRTAYGNEIREALEDLISAFDVDDATGTVSLRPNRILGVALLNAKGALEDTHIGPAAETIAQLQAERDSLRIRRKALEEALIAVRDRIIEPIFGGIDDTFWMTDRETVVDFIDIALVPPEQGKLALATPIPATEEAGDGPR